MKKILIFVCIVNIGIAFSTGVSGLDPFRQKIKPRTIQKIKPAIIITQPSRKTVALKPTTLRILWKRINLKQEWAQKFVMITLLPASVLRTGKEFIPRRDYVIALTAENSGQFAWRIPDKVKAGKYRIRIKTKDRKVSAKSAIFTIKDQAIKPACFKVDLAIVRMFIELDYPGTDVSGNCCFLIKNLSHPRIKFPSTLCFKFVARMLQDGSDFFSKNVCGMDLITLRNKGEVVLKFHAIDCQGRPTLKAIVDWTNVVQECDETNNSKIFY